MRLRSEPLDSPAVTELVKRLTNKESYFFRDEHLVNVLRELVIPLLIERSLGRSLTIWSAGCALGEEAYTLAILLQELSVGREGLHFNVVATDIDESAVVRARTAEYSQWSLRSLAAEAHERYFERRGARFVLRPRWRRNVRFESHNLVDSLAAPPSPGGFDLVFVPQRRHLLYRGRAREAAPDARAGAGPRRSALFRSVRPARDERGRTRTADPAPPRSRRCGLRAPRFSLGPPSRRRSCLGGRCGE